MNEEDIFVTARVDGEMKRYHSYDEIERDLIIRLTKLDEHKVADQLSLKNEQLAGWIDYLNEILTSCRSLSAAADELQVLEDTAIEAKLAGLRAQLRELKPPS